MKNDFRKTKRKKKFGTKKEKTKNAERQNFQVRKEEDNAEK